MAIQEESDEEEEASAAAAALMESFNVTKGEGADEDTQDAPKKVLIEEVKQMAAETKSADWWKKSGDSLNYDDFKPTKPAPAKEDKKDTPVPASQKFTRV